MIRKRSGMALSLMMGVYAAMPSFVLGDERPNDLDFGTKAGIVLSVKEDFLV